MPERDRYMRGMVAWVGFTQVPIYFDRSERFAGTTKYPLKKMIKLGMAGILGFSYKPLYLSVILGFAVLGVTFLGLVWILFSLIFGWGELVRGWASTALIVMFFAAVQLVCLGVMGIYISHLFTEVKHRPLFIVRNPRR